MKRFERLDSNYMLGHFQDVVWWPLYDFVRVERLQERYNFFQIPLGGVGMEPKTEADTNMYLPGQLPSGQQFLACGIRVLFVPDYEANRGRYKQDLQDLKRVLLAGTLRLQIQNRIYAQGAPLARFPSCFPMYSGVTPGQFRQYLRKRSLYRLAKKSYFEIVPVYIQATLNFLVSVEFDPAHRVKLNAPGRLGVILDGRIIRPGS